MTANLTQMPIGDEFVRAYAGHDGEKLSNVSLFPMHGFRVPTNPLQEIVQQALKDANELFDKEWPNTRDCNAVLNQRINDGIARLDSEGKVIRASLEHLPPEELQQMYNGQVVIYSCDGYTIFNPAFIPPTPSPSTH